MTTGEKIKNLRVSKGLSQEELGQRIGVKKAAINKYENGIVVNLKRSTIAMLAAALDTTPTYLMGFEEEKAPTPVEEGERVTKQKIILEKFLKLTDENLEYALAQLDVLINHQEKKNNP